jgi:hypothetical protein
MNERIKELAVEAEIYAGDLIDQGADYDEYPRYYTEKIAELIVRECAELAVNSQYANTKSEYYEGFNEALIYAGNKIRQHFGVKE